MTSPATPQQSPSNETPGEQWTVRKILEWTTGHLSRHGSDTPRLDAEILLAHARKCRRIQLYTAYDDELTPNERDVMRSLVQRRAKAEPVAYLVGHREFFGIDFEVTADVLVPRPETETLLMEALDAARKQSQPKIIDIGTGSGCLAISIAANVPAACVVATDISEAALAIACLNAERAGVPDRIEFRCGDGLQVLTNDDQFDIIVSNPPYIGENEFESLPPDVRLHEPLSALVSGPDGLTMLSSLISNAHNHLHPGGRLMLELAPEQGDAVRRLFAATGRFSDCVLIHDLNGQIRVATARVLAADA